MCVSFYRYELYKNTYEITFMLNKLTLKMYKMNRLLKKNFIRNENFNELEIMKYSYK